jgi:hypothetical protein
VNSIEVYARVLPTDLELEVIKRIRRYLEILTLVAFNDSFQDIPNFASRVEIGY